MKNFIKSNSCFLVPYFLFLFAGTVLIIADTKANKHLEFNSLHSFFFDECFYFITFLGDGVTPLLLTIILLFIKFRYAILIGISNLISSVITQTLKHTLFADVVRPKKFFEGIHDLYFVPGEQVHSYNSFPSGHATCAFALFFSFSLLIENKKIKFLFLLIALLVGYSRVYLSQHFFEDVYAGSLIGVFSVIPVFLYLKAKNWLWLEKSIIKL